MSTKIQINSLEALERLLGDDETMEMEVRASVIEAFARKFIKNAANAEAIAQQIKSAEVHLRKQVQEIVEKELGVTFSGWPRSVKGLSANVEKVIRSKANSEVFEVIDQLISGIELEPLVKSYVEGAVKRAVQAEVRKYMESKLAGLIKSEIN